MRATIYSFGEFNFRRYGTPWVCRMTERGQFDFSAKDGTYTANGNQGEESDLVVFEPVEGQVYGYGRKDYRGNNTMIRFTKWNGNDFVSCDKFGKEKEN